MQAEEEHRERFALRAGEGGNFRGTGEQRLGRDVVERDDKRDGDGEQHRTAMSVACVLWTGFRN